MTHYRVINRESRLGLMNPTGYHDHPISVIMASTSNTVIRTQEFRAYLSKAGHQNLEDFFHQATWLWNRALCKRKQGWERDTVRVSYYDQCKELTVTRQSDPEAWGRFYSSAQRSTLDRLDKAFKSFFRRLKAGEKPGYPRYRTLNRPVRSFEYGFDNARVKTNGGKYHWVNVKGIGRIRFRGCPTGTIKAIRVVKTVRRVKVQFVCEQPLTSNPDTRPVVGIDMGVRNRVVLSGGTWLPGVKLDRRELKRRQRRYSKAKRGSKNKEKRRLEHAREWQRVRERELAAIHELTRKIIDDHSANVAVEDLNIGGMVKNRHLSRAILEQAWGRIKNQLNYKTESAGGRLYVVNPAYTSQTCSSCGHLPDKQNRISLHVRVYRCQVCGLSLDRDVNAAINVRERALGNGDVADHLLPGGNSPVGATHRRNQQPVAASA